MPSDAAGPIHDRPWGSWQVLSEAPDHKVKRIRVKPGGRLSYQRHARRSEHWFIVSGEALVTLEGRSRALSAAQSLDVPLGAAHRIANAGSLDLTFIEVALGDDLAEDDITRLEDDYGRA
ncbi:MAG: phosphomannose isomerase type II C-terminal cupin domain [Elusimicrobiota bacterium]|jgi:mannose-6-phosphate isomerase